MIQIIIDFFLGSLALYLLFGMVFSVYFYVKGGQQLDEGVKGTPWHFKLIIFPGVVLFWSVLIGKIIRKS